MTTMDIIIRFVLATVIGAAIGFEREIAGRPAGLRTHVLVSVSSCLVMLSGFYISKNSSIDPTRMAAQVISGIGFLGAGTIMREGVNIKGLTTAATLWSVACVGIAAGCGFYSGAIITGFVVLVTLTIFEKLEKRTVNKKGSRLDVRILCSDLQNINPIVTEIFSDYKLTMRNISINTNADRKFEMEFNLFPVTKSISNPSSLTLIERLMDVESIINVSIDEY